jgi:hypothetical protein
LADAKSFSLPWVGRQAHDNSVEKTFPRKVPLELQVPRLRSG